MCKHIVHVMYYMYTHRKEISAREPLKLLTADIYEEWESNSTFPLQTILYSLILLSNIHLLLNFYSYDIAITYRVNSKRPIFQHNPYQKSPSPPRATWKALLKPLQFSDIFHTKS